jgi:HAD superfamily hydrolase (TIGR01509 family)
VKESFFFLESVYRMNESTPAAKGQPPVLAVVFDAGGVLTGNVPTKALKTLANRYSGDVAEQIRWAHKNQLGKYGICGHLWNKIKLDPTYTEEQYWKDFKQLVPEVRESVEDLQALMVESFNCFPEVLQLAQEIKDAGYTVAILSNHGTEWLDGIARKFNFYAVFDPDLVIVSQAVRCDKPSPQIYAITLERLQNHFAKLSKTFAASQTIFVDDKAENVQAAQQAGMKGIIFDAHKRSAQELKQDLISLGVVFSKTS